jgi:hypothetical protein
MTRPSTPTVFLHVGTPKSGTTYLQSRFSGNHEQAAQQGLLWPGPAWSRHVEAVRELWRLSDGELPKPGGPWNRLAREALGWRGESVLISMEWLSEVTPHQARVAVDSLRPARVEVICTARDLLRSFVAQSQEMAKNYRPWPWSQIVEEVLTDKEGPAHRRFWGQQDLSRILGTWLEVVPAGRVHLVTVPPPGADPAVLWDRFCDVLGIDGSAFTLPERDNASLGVVSTVLMQRLNRVAKERGLSHRDYARALRKAIAFGVLSPRRGEEGPIAVDEELETFLRARAEGMVSELRTLGLDVRGDWDDLVPRHSTRGRRPEEVTDDELLDLALEALVTLAVTTSKELDELHREVGREDGSTPARRRVEAVVGRAVRQARGAARSARGGTRRPG